MHAAKIRWVRRIEDSLVVCFFATNIIKDMQTQKHSYIARTSRHVFLLLLLFGSRKIGWGGFLTTNIGSITNGRFSGTIHGTLNGHCTSTHSQLIKTVHSDDDCWCEPLYISNTRIARLHSHILLEFHHGLADIVCLLYNYCCP